MKCPKCFAPTRVRSTRTWKDLFVKRSHSCFNDHNFTTYEVPREAVNEINAEQIRNNVVVGRTA